MKYCNGISIAALSFCGLSALSTASALDLRKVTEDLFYECRNEMSAGLHKDPKSGKIEATVFEVNPSDRWEMRLVRLQSPEDLEKVPNACVSEREKRGGMAPSPFYKSIPEFCNLTTYKAGGDVAVIATHCVVRNQDSNNDRYNALNCGLGDATYFDSDRLWGIDGSNSISCFGSKNFCLSATVSKFVCERLDR
jgi:hypothetical protein